jgi:hypothetical protein
MTGANELDEAGQLGTPGIVLSSDGLGVMMEQRCPLRIAPDAFAGCCEWYTFLPGFAEAWARWFDTPPTLQQWQMAKKDWRAGNTGWEAAHNAQRRAKERVCSRAVSKAMARALLASVAKRDA